MGNAITAFFWLFLSSQIPPDQYGELFYFIGIVATASAFVLFGNQNTLIVYVSKKIQIESTLYFISLMLGVVASFIIMILFYRVDTIFLLFGYIINTLAIGQLLGNKSFSLYSKYMLLQKGLTLSLGILFFIIFGSEGILYALALSYIFFIIVIFRKFRDTKINFKLLKNRSTFIVNNYAIDILTKINAHLNKFIIVPLLGFTVLGNFSLSLQIVNIGMIFTMIVFKYTISHDAQGQENKKLKKLAVIISIIIALFGMFIAPYVIPIFFPQYIEAIDAIRIISFSLIPMTITSTYSSKLLGREKNKRIVLSKIVSIATFIISILILGPFYGIIGLAFSYLLATIAESSSLIIKFEKLHSNKSS
ncbi:lipopolysaccharide biosynthesis protein [Nitrosopumilus adriaticus]|nr:polysaccharide biosynthesis C-terminal domain-containing protein [Nitrosopumilus adriaticus]